MYNKEKYERCGVLNLKVMRNNKTQYEVKVGSFWVVVSDIGYSHYKGERRIIKV
jgi:hypothetical protein